MSAKWLVGIVPVFVSEKDMTREVKRAELFVLDATSSSWQFFGAGSRHYSLKGIITDPDYYDDLETYAITDTSFTLTTPWGSIANCKLNKEVKGKSIRYGGGTFDGVAVTTDVTELIEVELEVIIP